MGHTDADFDSLRRLHDTTNSANVELAAEIKSLQRANQSLTEERVKREVELGVRESIMNSEVTRLNAVITANGIEITKLRDQLRELLVGGPDGQTEKSC